MNKALLTGASGFIGSHLYQVLSADDDWTVQVLPRSPLPDALNMTDQVVFHLAGLAHAGAQSDGRDALFEVNVKQTQTMFARAVDAGVQNFVWLSSCKVLGEESIEPLKSGAPLRPEGLYAESKAAAEEALLDYAALHHAEHQLRILRPPLVYGPGVKANFLSLLRWSLSGMPLPLSEAREPRSWIGVQNLCDLMVAIALHDETRNVVSSADKTSDGSVWHVSDNADASVAAMIRLIAAADERKARLLAVPPEWLRGFARVAGQEAAARRLLGTLQLDISATVSKLGWQPSMSVVQGIEKVVQWYLTQRHTQH